MGKNKNHIVIARYNEDLSWIKFIQDIEVEIFIYNKGGKIENSFPSNVKIIELKNIGRESHTYLHHIIENYTELPEKVVFTQGDPRDHVSNNFGSDVLDFLNSNKNFIYFSKNILEMRESQNGVEEFGNLNGSFWRNEHASDSCCVMVPFKLIKEINSKRWIFGTGAIFGVGKQSILSNTEEFYRRCINILEESSDLINPPEGHAFERSWYLIFN